MTHEFFHKRIIAYNNEIHKLLGILPIEQDTLFEDINKSIQNNKLSIGQVPIEKSKYLRDLRHGMCLFEDRTIAVSFYIGNLIDRGQVEVSIGLKGESYVRRKVFRVESESIWITLELYLLKLIKSTIDHNIAINALSIDQFKNGELDPKCLRVINREITIDEIIG